MKHGYIGIATDLHKKDSVWRFEDGDILVSENGNSWKKIAYLLGINRLIFDFGNKNTVAAVLGYTDGSVLLSRDYGNTWKKVPMDQPVGHIAFAGNNIIVTTREGIFWRKLT